MYILIDTRVYILIYIHVRIKFNYEEIFRKNSSRLNN